jgi:hypothetical protein
MKARIFVAALCLVGVSGCQSTDQQLDTQQQQAVDTALQRVKFDMNCPSATGQVLSRQMIAPVSIRFGVERRVHGRRRGLRPAPDDRRRLPAGRQRLLRGRAERVTSSIARKFPRSAGASVARDSMRGRRRK